MAKYLWGVDSSTNVTQELYNCVVRHLGTPSYWGRYLTTVPNASEGLTRAEIDFIQSKEMKILPIYNNFQASIGNRQGRVAAKNAIFDARRLGVPKGTVLFANVERFFDVDSEWIRGWVEEIYSSGYRSGLYNDPTRGNFHASYCQAARENNLVKSQTILWSAEPELGGTGPENVPKFSPKMPDCPGVVWVWQYGRDIQECPVDTNLANQRLLQYLW